MQFDAPAGGIRSTIFTEKGRVMSGKAVLWGLAAVIVAVLCVFTVNIDPPQGCVGYPVPCNFEWVDSDGTIHNGDLGQVRVGVRGWPAVIVGTLAALIIGGLVWRRDGVVRRE